MDCAGGILIIFEFYVEWKLPKGAVIAGIFYHLKEGNPMRPTKYFPRNTNYLIAKTMIKIHDLTDL